MSEEKLKPCPFCGASGDEIQVLHRNYGCGDETFEVCCRQCGGRGCMVTDEEDAIEEWNQRA